MSLEQLTAIHDVSHFKAVKGGDARPACRSGHLRQLAALKLLKVSEG
jgi:hypothetical protein